MSAKDRRRTAAPAGEPGDSAAKDSPAKDGQPERRRGRRRNGRTEPAGTRRKSVVFEEDDELDVPDFLK